MSSRRVLITPDASGDEWGGVGSSSDQEKGRKLEEEYEDEEQLATVTVVEDFNPDELIYGLAPTDPPASDAPPDSPSASASTPRAKVQSAKPRTPAAKRPAAQGKKAKRPKEIKYQTNSARRADKRKQLARHTEKAERAGGKQRKTNARRR
jgi:ribosomal RNA-processing protein 17